jgi:hypothetical protein
MILEGPFTKEAAASLGANLLVTIDTAGKAALCGASGIPLGSVQDAWASGALATIWPTCGRHKLTASAAIAIGDFVKAAASGKVAPEAIVTTATAFTIGQADSAASADGDAVYVYFRYC